MSTRINIQELQPKGYQAMFGLEKYLSQTQLDAKLKELIKIRVSQINGCAFCINMHTKDSRKLGETEQRIYALNAWKDTPFYTETERAVLALAEEITHISKGGVSDATYNNALVQLSDVGLAEAIMAINIINAWNRLAISTHLMPEVD